MEMTFRWMPGRGPRPKNASRAPFGDHVGAQPAAICLGEAPAVGLITKICGNLPMREKASSVPSGDQMRSWTGPNPLSFVINSVGDPSNRATRIVFCPEMEEP